MTIGIETGSGGTWAQDQSALGTQAATNAASTLFLRKATDDSLKPNRTQATNRSWMGPRTTRQRRTSRASPGTWVRSRSRRRSKRACGHHASDGRRCRHGSRRSVHAYGGDRGQRNSVFQSLREKTGVSVGPMRLVWWDAIYNDLTWNCGNDQNVSHLACGIQALKAAEIASLTDPVAVDSATDPWRWAVHRGHDDRHRRVLQ